MGIAPQHDQVQNDFASKLAIYSGLKRNFNLGAVRVSVNMFRQLAVAARLTFRARFSTELVA